jgi:hypothetical protein
VDEVAHNGQCYYVAQPSEGLNHAEAHDHCQRRGSRLLDLIDQPENDFISELLVQSRPQVDSVMTAGMGFTTLNLTIWIWEDSSVARFKYVKHFFIIIIFFFVSFYSITRRCWYRTKYKLLRCNDY